MSRWLKVLPDSWRQRYQQWLDRRIPRSASVQLSQRNLFIFLSRHGFYFLLLDALLWIGATNYQNNLIFALSFLILAVLFVAILQTFSHLNGVQLRFVGAEPVFSGEAIHTRFSLHAISLRQKIELHWPQQPIVSVTIFPEEPSFITLTHATATRGTMQLGRLHLQSVYPLGVVRCWSWLDFGVSVLVYPKPVEADYRLCCRGGNTKEAAIEQVIDGDEYFSLKPYAVGEPNSRIAWKQYAAGRGLYVREYSEERGGEVILDFSVMNDPDLELRLSKLCYCACFLYEQGRAFGLSLPNRPDIPVASGEKHWRTVLTALALFEV